MAEPLHFSDYDTRLAAYAVIIDERDDGDRILLTWFNGSTPGWTLPGGGIDYDESLEEGVAREVHEESGYDVEVGEVLAAQSSIAERSRHTDRPYKAVRLLYDATIVGGTLGTIEVGGTTDHAAWIPLSELDRPQPGHRADIVDLAVSAHRRRSAETQPNR